MLQQDYFLRLIREFFEALSLLRSQGRDIAHQQREIEKLYETYVGDSIFLHTAPLDDIMASFESCQQDERLPRMEMLAELYYAESDLKSGPARHELLDRARKLFIFIDHHSRTFSWQRQQRIIQLQKEC